MNPSDPMAAILNNLPPAPANPVAPGADSSIFGQPGQPFYAQPPATPVAPVYPAAYPPQPPAAYPQVPPVAPPPAYMQQPVAPGVPPNDYPMAPMPFAQPPQAGVPPMPAWGQQIIDAAAVLQESGGAAGGDDWPDRGSTWGEFRKAIQKEAEAIANTRIEAYKTEQKTIADQNAAQESQLNQQYDMVEGQLQALGYLPAPVNPSDPNDPSRLAKRELYAYAMSIGGTGPQHLGPAATTLKALHDSGMYFDYNQNKLTRRGSQTAAAQAPIAGGSPGFTTPGAPTGPTQAQLSMGRGNLGSLAEIGMAQLPQ